MEVSRILLVIGMGNGKGEETCGCICVTYDGKRLACSVNDRGGKKKKM